MSEALYRTNAGRLAARRIADAAAVTLLFLASYLLAIGIQQAVTVLSAKQLGGYSLTLQIGQGRVVYQTEVRTRRIELRERWWERPGYEWRGGMTPERAFLARLAGVGMNMLLACLGTLDLRHRQSRGLVITVLAHAAAAITAAVWGLA